LRISRFSAFTSSSLDLQVLLDPLEARLQRRGRELRQVVLVAPHREDRLRRAEGVAEVVDGGAADAAALQHDDAAVPGLPHARLLEEAGQHLVLALGEVGARPMRPLLEHHDREAGLGQLGGRHRAAGARADHAHVGV
jgi:hypothetical protein